MEVTKPKPLTTLIICITALLWGFFLWPTPYRYEKVSRPWFQASKDVIYRINRFTGHSELVVDPSPPSIEKSVRDAQK